MTQRPPASHPHHPSTAPKNDSRSPQRNPAPTAAPHVAAPAAASVTPAAPSKFAPLGLVAPLLRAVAETGYTDPTPIQLESIPILLQGRDLLGCAQTGTGKTAAFALPILQILSAARAEAAAAAPAPVPPAGPHGRPGRPAAAAPRPIRALILSPTRELASQIQESFETYGKYTGLTSTVIFGGVKPGPQIQRLRSGIDILVATPGRLLDLMGQGAVSLQHLTHFVLDEADRMLDMGFIHDVRKVLKALPAKRQSLLFSATMPQDIEALAMSFLTTPARVAVTPVASTAEKISQSVYRVAKNDKPRLLEYLLRNAELSRVLVFTRTKHGANKVVKQLDGAGIHSEAIHGNKSQNAREAALAHFKSGETRVLIATDIAARGIDVDNVSHVINYDLPNEPESYVHRIGRTARAGAEGIAIAFCDWDERGFLNSIEKLTNQRIPVVSGHPYEATNTGPTAEQRAAMNQDDRPRRGGGQPSRFGGPRGGAGAGQPGRGGSGGRPSERPFQSRSRDGGGDRSFGGGGGGGGGGGRPGPGGQRPARPAGPADESRDRRRQWAEKLLGR